MKSDFMKFNKKEQKCQKSKTQKVKFQDAAEEWVKKFLVENQ